MAKEGVTDRTTNSGHLAKVVSKKRDIQSFPDSLRTFLSSIMHKWNGTIITGSFKFLVTTGPGCSQDEILLMTIVLWPYKHRF